MLAIASREPSDRVNIVLCIPRLLFAGMGRKVLANEGLVEILPNCSALLVRLTLEDVTHSFKVIGGLERL